MSVKEAATEMASMLQGSPTLQSVGVAGQVLIAYTHRLTRVPITWRGFKVEQRVIGRVKPALLLILAALVIPACSAVPPPAPVAVTPISLAGIEAPIRRAVRANDSVGLRAERQRLLLEEAERILAGRTFSK